MENLWTYYFEIDYSLDKIKANRRRIEKIATILGVFSFSIASFNSS